MREHDDVAAEARKQGETVHFGHLMALCHEKHSELQRAVREFKGRVVFHGDDVKDEEGGSKNPFRVAVAMLLYR